RRLRPVPRVHGPGDRTGQARRHHRRHRLGVATGGGVRFPGRRGGVRAAVRPRSRPGDLGEAHLQPAGLAGAPRDPGGGHGLRAGDLLARLGRVVSGPDRRGGRGHRGRLRSDHQAHGRGAAGRRPAVLDGERPAQPGAGGTVTPEHRGRTRPEARGGDLMTTVTDRAELSATQLLDCYEQMAVIRRTENAAQDLFLAGLVKGTTHLAAGQEAVAVGASAALREDDYVFATYRGHHHAIARGATPEECLAELMQKATGVCKAKGGSMHLTRADKHMLGSYAIVGAHLPMAAGAAWSAMLRGTGQIA